jgi:integrase
MSLAFMAGGRRRKLFRQKNAGPWLIRFQYQGKDICRSLGTTIEAVAKDKAKQIVEAEMSGDTDKSRELKMRSDACTLREVCDRFLEKYGRSRTGRGYVGGLKKLVRVALGISDAVKDPLTNAKATVLTAKLIRDFEAAEEQRIARDRAGALDRAAEMRVRTSITSRVRQARSIFSPKCMHWYEDLNLPNLDGFRAQGVRAPRRRGDPRPLDEAAIAGMFEDSTRLAVEDPACYVAFILFSLMGMRNSEIKKARKGWLRRNGTGWMLDVIDRPEEDFFCKHSTMRNLPVAPEIVNILEQYYKQSPDGDFLVPAAHKTERDQIVDDRHSAWAGKWIKDYTKSSYELRRYAGSLVLKKTGSMKAVQKYLGHSSIGTTEKYYAYMLGELPALSFADFTNGHSLG